MRAGALVAALAAAACRPDLGDPPSLIAEPRILAVRSEPAEVQPDRAVAYQVLIAAPDGAGTAAGAAAPDVRWGFCTDPAPLSSNNVVNDGCLTTAAALPGTGPAVEATIPLDACSTFGPTPPAPLPGQPPRRPHDADVTGGYYQPVRALATLDGDPLSPGIGLTRITCDLPDAPFDVVSEFRRRYRANTNPTLTGVAALGPDGAALASPGTAALPALPPRTAVTLRASWTADSAEPFPVFDPASRTLVDHREAIRVSWFASAGALASDRTGRGEAETETFADDVWTTPDAGPAYLWVVVRDSRGGLAFAGYAVTIAP